MKRIYMAIISILCSIGIAIAISHAWFVNGYDVDPLAKGQAADAYYYSGTGTQGDPYIITTPRHLYNLAWLQYLGTYNKPVDNNSSTYKDFYFKLGKDIDCTGWKLPPIGTSVNPFISSFDGDGHTISNLNTTNDFSDFDRHPDIVTSGNFNGCNTIGFFGSVGAFDTTAVSGDYLTGENTTKSSPVVNNNEIKKFYLSGCTVKTSVSTTLIGAVAGYVNATVSNVGLVTPHLNVQANNAEAVSISSRGSNPANISDFAVVGYAEDEYTTQKTKNSTIIYNPTYDYAHFNFKGMGSQADWGGSMDMKKLYNRLVSINNVSGKTSITEGYSYTGYELKYNGINRSTIIGPNTTYTRISQEDQANGDPVVPMWYKDYSESNGTYLKTKTSGLWTVAYQGLSALYKDVIIVTKETNTKNGYVIKNKSESRTLDLTSTIIENTINFDVSINNSSSYERVWIFEGNQLYTYSEDDGYKYYLCVNGSYELSVLNENDENGTTWSWDTNFSTFSYTDTSNNTHYLNYINDEWQLGANYVITDGVNYVVRNDSAISTTTTLADATIWYFSSNTNNPNGYLTDISDNSQKLAVNDNSLVANNSGTSWSYDGNNLFSGNKVVKFNGTTWIAETLNTYLIQYNGHYLTYNLSDTTTRANATQWTLSNTLSDLNGNGTISYNDGNNTYYLRYYYGLTTTNNADQATTWYHDQYGIYHNDGTKYYIQYNGGWVAAEPNKTTYTMYDIYYSFRGRYNTTYTYYLNRANTNSTTQSPWVFTTSGSNPSGTVYQVSGNTIYYLNITSSGPTVSTTTPHTFTNINGYLKDDTTGYYLFPKTTTQTSGWSSYAIFGGWLSSSSQPSNKPSYSSNGTYSIDNYESTPIAQIGVYTNYISRCDKVSISLNKSALVSTNIINRSDPKEVAHLFNYIPLNASTSNIVESNNTGYIMSGGYHPESHFDIRVSQYAISSINGSYSSTSKSWVNNGIMTVGANGINYIGSSNYPESNYSKYTASKDQLFNTLKTDNSYVYGLHFMNATISRNHLITASKVLINGKESPNYQMPEDCIDFQLASKGYINFFAGAYFTNNNSFFSLHEIVRDSSNEITDIKHIVEIYQHKTDKSADFIYKYSTGDYSSNAYNSSTYKLVFNSSWIESPGSISSNNYKNKLFYFEIPVNKGEYALGSVEGGTGGYLIYLDIGANAAPVDRTIITQQTTSTQESLVYVNGIQILEADTIFSSDVNSCVAIIEKHYYGLVDISRLGNTITFDADDTLESTYKDEGIILSGASWAPIATLQTTSKVLRYIDFNRSTEKLYYTTIYNNGTSNTSYDCYRIDNISTGEKTKITDTTDQAEWGILTITNGSGVNTKFANYENIANKTYGSTKILDYYSYIDTASQTSYSQTIEMTVAADSTVVPEPDGQYVYEHSYHLSGNAITMAPNGLIVNIGPTLKNSATISEPANNVVTVTIGSYVFTFNANAMNNTNKTVTIHSDVPR